MLPTERLVGERNVRRAVPLYYVFAFMLALALGTFGGHDASAQAQTWSLDETFDEPPAAVNSDPVVPSPPPEPTTRPDANNAEPPPSRPAVEVESSSDEIAKRKKEVLDFLNGYVNSSCDFIVSRAPFGGKYTHFCKFYGSQTGLINVTVRDGTSDELHKVRYAVYLSELNPSDIQISNNPGFGSMDILLYCTNRAECVRRYDGDQAPPDKWEYVPIGSRFRDEIDKMSQAFEAAIRLYGGQENPF